MTTHTLAAPLMDSASATGPPDDSWPTCRTCGCWEYNACYTPAHGPCYWVENNLCSHCPADGKPLILLV